MNIPSRFVLLLVSFWLVGPALAADWLTQPSYFTHDPHTGHRVWQYAPIPPVAHTPQHGRSSYRHARSSLQIGDSIDQFHVVDEYGRAVRPYGEWRFPYRPFSVPYPWWGPAYGGFGYGYGLPPGAAGGIGSPFGPFGVINGAGFPPPYNDGSYPDVRRNQLPPRDFNVTLPGVNQTTNNINGNANTTNSPTSSIQGNANTINNSINSP